MFQTYSTGFNKCMKSANNAAALVAPLPGLKISATDTFMMR